MLTKIQLDVTFPKRVSAFMQSFRIRKMFVKCPIPYCFSKQRKHKNVTKQFGQKKFRGIIGNIPKARTSTLV